MADDNDDIELAVGNDEDMWGMVVAMARSSDQQGLIEVDGAGQQR